MIPFYAHSRYGSKVGQSINLSITPPGGPLSLVINVSLIVGILFTFSLQMMPVYDVIEPLIFTQCMYVIICHFSSLNELRIIYLIAFL